MIQHNSNIKVVACHLTENDFMAFTHKKTLSGHVIQIYEISNSPKKAYNKLNRLLNPKSKRD